MSNVKDRIPTLTDIIEAGDPEMENHFDGSYFEQTMTQEISRNKQADLNELREHIEAIVAETLRDTLPMIEEQLKQQLTKKILQQLDN